MRYWLLLIPLVFAGCTQATASKVDARTFRIEGPDVPGGSDTPDRRLAERICPKGYRILESASNRGGLDRAIDDSNIVTSWTIRCL
jgi:hypothetical protein